MEPDRPIPPLLIRADAGPGIGNGHVMRCLALGQAAREKGGRVAYLGRVGSSELERRLRGEGFECRFLPDPHPHPGDLEATLAALSELRGGHAIAPWLVLDGYHFDPAYQREVRGAGWPLLVVDDAADRPSYPASVLLNQNLGAERLSYRTDPDTLVLAGVRHVLLRRQFLARKGWRRSFPDEARRVLVTLGGSDPENVTLQVFRALGLLGDRGFEVTAAVGSNNPHLESLEKAAREFPFPIEIRRDADDMPELMAWADLAVSAAGSTTWELAFMGLPAVLLVLAENQRGIARELDRSGAAVDLGWFREIQFERLSQAVADLSSDRERRRSLGERGRALVDGEGARRVLEELAGRSASGWRLMTKLTVES